MEDRKYLLGEDLFPEDCLLDPIRFSELILTAHCNCRTVNKKSIMDELKSILDIRFQDMKFLLERNMDIIIQLAKNGREIK